MQTSTCMWTTLWNIHYIHIQDYHNTVEANHTAILLGRCFSITGQAWVSSSCWFVTWHTNHEQQQGLCQSAVNPGSSLWLYKHGLGFTPKSWAESGKCSLCMVFYLKWLQSLCIPSVISEFCHGPYWDSLITSVTSQKQPVRLIAYNKLYISSMCASTWVVWASLTPMLHSGINTQASLSLFMQLSMQTLNFREIKHALICYVATSSKPANIHMHVHNVVRQVGARSGSPPITNKLITM